MAGRWNEERGWRSEGPGRRDGRDGERWDGAEGRSFGRDRVFGERESGMGYNQPRDISSRSNSRPAWQDPDYEGVSPGFRQHEADYEREHPRFQSQDYTRAGGRFYGDDGRGRAFREEPGYGAGPRDDGGRYQEGRRFGTREADDRWSREMRRPVYDDARGEEGFETRAREAGEFFRRTGRRMANWFSDVAGEGSEMGRYEERGARGLGPKGYKRADERINDDAHQHLTDDPWLDASEIDVAVANGEVTLSGKVENREAKHRAEHLVEDLSGVTHVQNNLRVRTYGTETRVRTEGDAATETSANAHNTTTRGRA